MMLSTATLDMPTGYKILNPQTELTYLDVQALTIHRDFIYVVMMCERMGVKNFFPDFGSSRLVGWYGINECCYDYALIEKIEEGLYQPANSGEHWWFKYDHETNTYVPVEEPKEYEHYSGFTIG